MARIPDESGTGFGISLQIDGDKQEALVIAISQSGETADTLAALRLAKEKGMQHWQS